MKLFSISYDLRYGEPEDYEGLIEGIKTFSSFCRLTKSEWLVRSPKSAQQIGGFLSRFVKQGDKLTVKILDLAHGWFDVGLSPKVTAWIDRAARKLKLPVLPRLKKARIRRPGI